MSNIRTEQHYRDMISKNPDASIGWTLAAKMICAARHGEVDVAADSEEWREIARDLQTRLGENISASDVLAEMNAQNA